MKEGRKGVTLGSPHRDMQLVGAKQSDGPELAELRVRAMRESLERIGRYDPERARNRFLTNFVPEDTQHIDVSGTRTGFVVLAKKPDHLLLDHLYIDLAHQNQGIGAAVLERVQTKADDMKLDLRVGALRQSDSNRFYTRHGFDLVEETEFDNYYVRRFQKTTAR